MTLQKLGLGALAVALALGTQTAASAQPYGGYRHGQRTTTGTIASVNGTNVTLRDGRQVFLKQGTVINPTGTRLQPGQRISVAGNPGGNGAINATLVTIGGYGSGGNGFGGARNGYRYGNGYANGNTYGQRNGYGARSARGIVARVNGSNVTLQDGRQIFLKGGTVISPRGQQLQPGERIFVQGNPGGNGAIDATSVSIEDRRGYRGRF